MGQENWNRNKWEWSDKCNRWLHQGSLNEIEPNAIFSVANPNFANPATLAMPWPRGPKQNMGIIRIREQAKKAHSNKLMRYYQICRYFNSKCLKILRMPRNFVSSLSEILHVFILFNINMTSPAQWRSHSYISRKDNMNLWQG